VRDQLLDLAQAPRLPIDFAAYQWQEPFPGFRIATVRQDKARGMTAGILWGKPGARFPGHRHEGDEAVLVLQGAYRDELGTYGPGQIARRPKGSVHAVEIASDQDCISYIVSYGDVQIL
jgi:putative transcriptional regulator